VLGGIGADAIVKSSTNLQNSVSLNSRMLAYAATMRSARTRAWQSPYRCAVLICAMIHRLPCGQPSVPWTELQNSTKYIRQIACTANGRKVIETTRPKALRSSSSSPRPMSGRVCLGLLGTAFPHRSAVPEEQGGSKLSGLMTCNAQKSLEHDVSTVSELANLSIRASVSPHQHHVSRPRVSNSQILRT
jgi:hypothetical protein